VREGVRVLRPATVRRYAICLELFRRWVLTEAGGAQVSPSILSKRLMSRFYEYMLASETGRHGRARTPLSAQKIVAVVQSFWTWAYSQEEYGDAVPRPRKLPFAKQPRTPTVAPSWDEMDRAIAACSGWQQQVAIILRFTGLRVQQVMQLKWSDFDLLVATLKIRGELGKTPQERQGRIVPISACLVQELQTWKPVPDRKGWVIDCGREANGPRAREARARDMMRAWKRAGVREDAWKQRPHHAFRKGFKSGLKRLGADDMAVEFLLGHSLGIAGVYTDPEALPMRDAVNRIPALAKLGGIVEFDRGISGGSEPGSRAPGAR
jgi:integrase